MQSADFHVAKTLFFEPIFTVRPPRKFCGLECSALELILRSQFLEELPRLPCPLLDETGSAALVAAAGMKQSGD
jgi:hypothetical protein